MNQTVMIKESDYRTFISVINLLKEPVCSSISIEKGIIRQMSDKKDVVFDIDLTSIIGDITLYLHNIGTKFFLLNEFNKNKVDMNISFVNDYYIFHDNHSKVQFSIPKKEYLENKFITETEFKNKIVLDDDNFLFETTFQDFILKRFNSFSKTLKSERIYVDFSKKDKTVDFKLIDGDKSTATIIKLKTVEDVFIEHEGSSLLSCVPFTMDTPELNVKYYNYLDKSGNKNGKFLVHMNGTIGFEPMVNVNIYCPTIMTQ